MALCGVLTGKSIFVFRNSFNLYLRCTYTRWLWSTQLKSHLARTGGHCPSEGEDKTFFKYHGITLSMCHVTRWVRFPHPKSQIL